MAFDRGVDVTVTRVSDSAVLLARPEALWKTIRHFNNVALWHPDVQDSCIEDNGPDDRVGAVRLIHLRDGTKIREQITALSDKDLSYSYSVIESPMPLRHHSSTVSLTPVEGGTKTLVTWYAEFALEEGDPGAVGDAIHQGVMLAGFRGLGELATEPARLTIMA